MDSILQGTAATLQVTFTADGTPVDPTGDAATVTITRADGTAVVTDDVATKIATGVYGYTLDPDATAQLGRLTAAWTGEIESVTQTLHTRAEVVGGYYFTVGEFKAAYPSDTGVQALSAAAIADARALAEEIIERACRVAFVPRAKRLTLSGQNRARLTIPLYRVRAITQATVNGAVVDPASIAQADSSAYRLYWLRGFGNIVVTVEHGYDEPPLEIKEAAMTLTKHRAIKGPIDDRAIGIPTDGGIVTLATPGLRGAVTGLPSVDQAIAQYALADMNSFASVSLSDSGNLYPAHPSWDPDDVLW